ncbi:MAG: hypothetical protein ACREBA_01975 [Nitrosotalea sp.]
MTEIQNPLCEDSKCQFNRDGIRHNIQDHEKLKTGTTLEKVFEPKAGGYLYAMVKGGLSSIPIAGGVISEIFSTVKTSPYNQRMRTFLQSVNERLVALEKNGKIDVESLVTNDEFFDIVIQATEIAVKNSQTEKLEALQNCVTNTALKINIDRDRKMMYLNIVNQITPSHLLVLRLIANPETAIRELVANQSRGVERNAQVSVLSDLRKFLTLESEFFKMTVNELESWGILQNVKSEHSSGLAVENIELIIQGLIGNAQSRVTTRGHEFLRFIGDEAVKNESR